ncbi:hypothetical protein LEP1GSC196_0201 [Leptospira meyeri serovar Semaranga str. Veldrot Semarang 173]|nr:hypothetical protein LEP1GSC196_0201 [Leptospira meyeri serovar Semaranga str. Veldrot Semarang 173]
MKKYVELIQKRGKRLGWQREKGCEGNLSKKYEYITQSHEPEVTNPN